MDFLYDVSERITKNVKIEPGRVVVILAMAGWFAVGAAVSVAANLVHIIPEEMMINVLLNLGAVFSIIFGFVGSICWILRNK